MDKYRISKENGKTVPCISEIPDPCRKIVIVIHGFNSSKESRNVMNLMRHLPRQGIGVVAYDQPGHGMEEAAQEPLRVKACLDSLSAVEDDIRKRYPLAEICYFGSSFGGYILGLYLVLREHAGGKAFMRCAAVVFPQMVIGRLDHDPQAQRTLRETGSVVLDLGIDAPGRFTQAFLQDLRNNDLLKAYEQERPSKEDLYFVHGEKDPVVPLSAVEAFTRSFGYALTVVPDEGHTISDHEGSPDLVAELACRHFLQPLSY